MAEIKIQLKPAERDALRVMARRELRAIDAQATLLVREALERRGLLPKAIKAIEENHGSAEAQPSSE